MSHAVFKIQTTLPVTVRDAFLTFAKTHKKRPSDVCRDALATYLVAHGALQSSEQCSVKRGAAQALATASTSEKKRLRKHLIKQAELMRQRKKSSQIRRNPPTRKESRIKTRGKKGSTPTPGTNFKKAR